MKNQYFGDLNDYRKYGLLRAITGMGALTTTVCWMLTADDGSWDGRLTHYLRQPTKWRAYDPALFDCLQQIVLQRGARRVQEAQCLGILPGARYYDALLSDKPDSRRRYFNALWRLAEGSDLLFFDPDNGMEVRSCPYGRRGSSRYLYWRELRRAFLRGHAVLVYQHFPRVKRQAFIERMAAKMVQVTGAPRLYSFQTARVVYFLLLSRYQRAVIERHIDRLAAQWGDQIRVREHHGG